MGKIKLIAIDLDDTLLNSQLTISARNTAAIKAAMERGVAVAIATGRMYRSALPYAEELNLKLPIISYQGALIKERTNGKILSHQAIPCTLARKIAQETEKLGYHLNAYVNDHILIKENTVEGEYYQTIANVPMNVVGSLVKNLSEDPTKLLVINEEENLNTLWEKLNKLYGSQLHLTKSKPDFLEITAKGAHKGYGVKFLADQLGIEQKAVMVIGDSYNDMPMFEYAGLSVAVANARADVQAKAHVITGSNEDSGVGQAIEEYVLI